MSERRGNVERREPKLVLTIDWEDYYHICDLEPYARPERWHEFPSRIEANTERLLKILSDHGAQATFFMIGHLAEQYPHLVDSIQQAGHEIAWHGRHHYTWCGLSSQQRTDEWFDGLVAMRDRFGVEIKGFRAPMWSLTPELLHQHRGRLNELGLRYDSSLVPLSMVGDTRYPRQASRIAGITELPPTIVSFFGIAAPVSMSWGFRWLPWLYIKWQITRQMRINRYVMMAIHPWELDPDHPRLTLPRGIHFSHYAGLRNTERRLKWVLSRYRSIGCLQFLAYLEEKGAKLPEFGL